MISFFVSVECNARRSNDRSLDSMQGMDINIPKGWSVGSALSDEVMRLSGREGAHLIIKWFSMKRNPRMFKKIASKRHPSLKLSRERGYAAGSSEVVMIPFVDGGNFVIQKGTLFYRMFGRTVVELMCIYSKDRSAETYYECRKIVGDLNFSPTTFITDAVIQIKRSRLEGDLEAVRTHLGRIEKIAHGREGAIAFYEVALAFEESGDVDAIKYLKRAIACDASYVPTYISLGRVLLASGKNPIETTDRIMEILDRAPKTKDIEKLKRKIIALDLSEQE